IPSCTACYFDAPDRLVEMGDRGVLFRFLNDQQWCILWYLYLGADGKQAIVASSRPLDVDDQCLNSTTNHEEAELWICAPDFETFLFRFWLENNIWFIQHDRHRAQT